MAVAFIALLAALTGTAVALPGSNTVDSGDIRNSQVKTQDIRNSTVRGKDVRANTITGSDVNEGTLGKVPSAAAADTATSATNAANATNATNANNAENAGTLDGVDSTGFLNNTGNRILSASDNVSDDNYTADGSLQALSNLPGGTYGVVAKVEIDNDTAGAETVNCDIVRSVGLAVLDTSTQTHGAQGAGAQILTYTLTGQFTMGAGGTDDLFVRCTNPGGDNDANQIQILAMREGN